MAPTNPLDELRRRIGHGTTPVAFAALAEEHRRAGRLDEAVAVCREGLERYPTYASARVTLGRALLDLGDLRGALSELVEAVTQAPDNLAAARALDTVRQRLGDEADPAPAASMNAAPALETLADAAIPADTLAWLGPVADEAADDVGEASFASELPAADDEPSVAAAAPATVDAPVAPSLWDAIVPTPADQEAPFSWGVAPTATPSDSAFASWNATVEDAVADVFAEAAGGATPAAAADGPAPADHAIDSLQTLLATIRARRALLSETHSGVD